MKHSKKGITLVELIICCAIIVMLGGACSAVLASGSTIFYTSSHTANAQLDAEVLQNFMMNLIPSTTSVEKLSDTADPKTISSGNCLYFDEENDNIFTVRVNGKDTSIRSVTEFEYEIIRAGDPDSDTARAQFVYTVTLADGNSLSGGFVLSNMKFDAGLMPEIYGKVSENPFRFEKTS